jgi:alcohol dehydrogenase (cytochrome c)
MQKIGIGIVSVLALCMLSSSANSESSRGSEWEGYNKTLDGQRFSTLNQINTTNASDLSEVCRVRLADRGSLQSGLIMVGDLLFVTTATDTFALDPVTCGVKWKHVYRRSGASVMPVNRGVAYLNGRVFRGTDDARLIALDSQTGLEVWSNVIGDAGVGEFVSGAPVAWNGLVIVGLAVSEAGIRGRIMAYDVATGREVWRFNTVPLGKEVGADTWANTTWAMHGGGSTWSTFTIDPATGELFIPVGNPVPDFLPEERPGANLFTDSVLVLDAQTGELRWWYQLAPHDSYDHDLGAAPMLFRNSRHEEMVAAAGKDGFLHVVSRASHELRFKVPLTTIDAVPIKLTPAGVKVCPGVSGGVDWNGPAMDSPRMMIFVGAVDFCSIVRSGVPGSAWAPGLASAANFGGTWAPSTDSATGWITAVDADSGKIRWKYHAEAAVTAGVTATEGGIVMSGDNKGSFLIFESATGKLLKKVSTGGAVSGGVITYEVRGKQYVAFTSGSVSRTVWGATGRPSIIVMSLPGPPAEVVRSNLPDAVHGKQVFLTACAVCHGVNGNNVGGVDLSKSSMTTEQLVTWIKNPAPPMPKMFPEPLDVDDEVDIRDVAAYLKNWR